MKRNSTLHILFIGTLIIALFFPAGFAQEKGKIGGFDDAAKPEKKDTASVSRTPPVSAGNSSGEGSADMSAEDFFLMAELTYEIVRVSFVITASVFVQAPGEDSSWYDNTFWTRGYSLYPYFRDGQGVYSTTPGKTYRLSAYGERFDDFDNVTGYGGTIRASFHPAFSIEGSVQDLKERLAARSDHIRFYRFGLNYHRVRSERASVWWGLGLKGMSATTVHTSGFMFNAGGEFFPIAPLSVNIEYSAGAVNDKTLHEFTAGVRFHINRFAVNAGFRQFSIGRADLSGFTTGISMIY